MRILFAISLLCFLALAWATFAIARHVRRSTGLPLAEAPGASFAAAASTPLIPNRAKPGKYPSGQRHDHTFASSNSGDLKDPEARVSTRPPREAGRQP